MRKKTFITILPIFILVIIVAYFSLKIFFAKQPLVSPREETSTLNPLEDFGVLFAHPSSNVKPDCPTNTTQAPPPSITTQVVSSTSCPKPPNCGEQGANTQQTCSAGRCIKGVDCTWKGWPTSACGCNKCEPPKTECSGTFEEKACCLKDETCCENKMCCKKETPVCVRVYDALGLVKSAFCSFPEDCPSNLPVKCTGGYVKLAGANPSSFNKCCPAGSSCGYHFQSNPLGEAKTTYCVKSSCDPNTEIECTDFTQLTGGKLCCPKNAPCKKVEVAGGFSYACSATSCKGNEEMCIGKKYSICCPQWTCVVHPNGVPDCRK